MTKLTLSIDKQTVAKAKKIASSNGTSVSAMFSQFVKSIGKKAEGPRQVGPLTRKLTGIIKLPRGKSYKDLLTDALEDRYRR